MEPSSKDIEELRSRFFKKLDEHTTSDSDPFHPADIDRIKASDTWLRRFLMHHELDQKEALNMLWETCDWRKKFGANDISEKNINMSIIEEGSLFAHNRDKDGKSLLIFKSKKHVKGNHDFDELKRCLIYWMERLDRQDKGDMISIFFDMDGAGLSNMDMEYTKYLIGLFKSYYPYYLNYILIFEMAWVLNAAFKIIKSWLPPKAVQKIKFLSKSNLKEYVEAEQALKSWGGKDEYVFVFEPEQRPVVTVAVPGDESKKKVHFADGSPLTEPAPGINDSGIAEGATSLGSTKLTIMPPDIINIVNEGAEPTGSVVLRNDDVTGVSYKIKTTSPEKYRVRPSTGTLAPGSSVTIQVVLQTGFQVTIASSRDKFLILSIPVENVELSQQELTDLWRQSSGKEVEQHRLRCNITQPGIGDSGLRNGSAFATPDEQKLNKLSTDMNKLHTHISVLNGELKVIQRQQWILLVAFLLLAAAVLYSVRGSAVASSSEAQHQTCFAPPSPHHSQP